MPRSVLGPALVVVALATSACNSFKGTRCSCATEGGGTEEIVTDGSCAAVQQSNPGFTACTTVSQGDIGPLGPTIAMMEGPPETPLWQL